MRIQKLHIQNYKSLVDFHLENVPQFCAFVGPNASGKSNIFEALEFMNYYYRYNSAAIGLFGSEASFFSFKPRPSNSLIIHINDNPVHSVLFEVDFKSNIKFHFSLHLNEVNKTIVAFASPNEDGFNSKNFEKGFVLNKGFLDQETRKKSIEKWVESNNIYEDEYEVFFDKFSRIFIGKQDLKKIPTSTNRLTFDASNLPQILNQIFQNKDSRIDFIEWLRILIPEFQDIEVKQSNIDGTHDFFIFEKGSTKPFPRHLLSDGTKNILALMAAVYQTNHPQFLCFEEPENGLHPQAIHLLVDFFREKCEEEGHHIWLNTHSQSLVRCLEIDEIVTVNKINGETQARQFALKESFGMKMDEAWLTNALGGGVL
jgi:predicted ATPase